VMKSASTPSMSSPSIMFVVQFKRIISGRQLQGLMLGPSLSHETLAVFAFFRCAGHSEKI